MLSGHNYFRFTLILRDRIRIEEVRSPVGCRITVNLQYQAKILLLCACIAILEFHGHAEFRIFLILELDPLIGQILPAIMNASVIFVH